MNGWLIRSDKLNFIASHMPDLSKRSYQKEILDGEDIPFEDIKQNMYELDKINSWLGGHRITLKGLQQLIGGETRLPELGLAQPHQTL